MIRFSHSNSLRKAGYIDLNRIFWAKGELMSNLDRYNKVFIECFSVGLDQLDSNFIYQGTSTWDSIGHMSLISLLESEFEIMIEMDDVIDFGSYTIGMTILKKYGVEI